MMPHMWFYIAWAPDFILTNAEFNRDQGGSNEKILVGPFLSNDDVIRAMTSLIPSSFQNIGGAAAPVAPPVATPLVESYFKELQI